MKLNFNPLYFNTLVPSESDAGNLKKINSNYLFSDIIKIYSEENNDINLQEIELKSFSSEELFAKIDSFTSLQINEKEINSENTEQDANNLAVLSIINNLMQAITTHPEVNLADIQAFPIEKISENVLEDGNLILNLKMNDQEIKVHLEKENIEVDQLNFETKIALYNALRTLEELGETEKPTNSNSIKVQPSKNQLDLFSPDEKVNLLFEEVVNHAASKDVNLNNFKIELNLEDEDLSYFDIENDTESINSDVDSEIDNPLYVNAGSKIVDTESDTDLEINDVLGEITSHTKKNLSNSYGIKQPDVNEINIEISNYLKSIDKVEKDPELLKKNLLLTVKQLNELENIGIKIKNIEFITNNNTNTNSDDLFVDASSLKNTMAFVVSKESVVKQESIPDIIAESEYKNNKLADIELQSDIKTISTFESSEKTKSSNGIDQKEEVKFSSKYVSSENLIEAFDETEVTEEKLLNATIVDLKKSSIEKEPFISSTIQKEDYSKERIDSKDAKVSEPINTAPVDQKKSQSNSQIQKEEITPNDVTKSEEIEEAKERIIKSSFFNQQELSGEKVNTNSSQVNKEEVLLKTNELHISQKGINLAKIVPTDKSVNVEDSTKDDTNSKIKFSIDQEKEHKEILLDTNEKSEFNNNSKSELSKNENNQQEIKFSSESKENKIEEVAAPIAVEEPIRNNNVKSETDSVRPIEHSFSKISNEIKSSPILHSPKMSAEELFINTNEIIPELSKILSDGDKKSLSINLLPEELGKIKVVVETTKNNVEAKIEVQNEAAKTLIQNNIEALKSSLSQAGMQLNNLSISVAYQEQKHQKFTEPRKKNTYKNSNENSQVKVSLNEGKVKSLGYNTYEYTV